MINSTLVYDLTLKLQENVSVFLREQRMFDRQGNQAKILICICLYMFSLYFLPFPNLKLLSVWETFIELTLFQFCQYASLFDI